MVMTAVRLDTQLLVDDVFVAGRRLWLSSSDGE